MKKMVRFQGKMLTRADSYGYRPGNPESDVDSDGQPVQSNYIVLVKVADCQTNENPETGAITYNPEGVAQAEKLGYGGTNYGYKSIERTARDVRFLKGPNGEEFAVNKGDTYIETRMFAVITGRVYSTRWFRPSA